MKTFFCSMVSTNIYSVNISLLHLCDRKVHCGWMETVLLLMMSAAVLITEQHIWEGESMYMCRNIYVLFTTHKNT